MFEELPKLTKQQNDCVLYYFTCCMGNKIQSYRKAYDCKNSNEKTISKEAAEFFKNPRITPWLEYYTQTITEFQQNEIKYSLADFFEDLERIRVKTEDSPKTVSTALKAIELKGKAFGLFNDKEVNSSVVVNMGSIEKNGKELKFDIGDE